MSNLPARLEDVVTERIRATVAELMPEEQWRALVESAIKEFTSQTSDWHGTRASPIQKMIFVALEKHFGQQIEKALASDEFRGVWGVNGGEQPSKGVTEIVRQLTPEIIAAAYGSMIQGAVAQLRNNLQQTIARVY